MLTDLIKNFTSEPFSHFNDLEREFNRLFGPLHGVSSRHTTPAMNVWSSNEATHVVAEIPGVDPKDVDVSLEDRTLTIRGVRKPEVLAEGETAIHREHTHGKFARTIELATAERIPAIVISCSGGARMHEGALSLMQMGKTSGAIARMHDAGGLYISVLANPTTGGVMASFAALGDVILAEPGALIGFAGPRVIRETLRTELPKGFQTAEFLLERGFIDRIVKRSDLRDDIATAIDFLWTYTDEQREKYVVRGARAETVVVARDALEGEGEGVEGGGEATDRGPDAS